VEVHFWFALPLHAATTSCWPAVPAVVVRHSPPTRSSPLDSQTNCCGADPLQFARAALAFWISTQRLATSRVSSEIADPPVGGGDDCWATVMVRLAVLLRLPASVTFSLPVYVPTPSTALAVVPVPIATSLLVHS
jgi:hypothetical protein